MTPFAGFARPRGTPRRAKSRGQAVVEFALILPVFLVMTLGVVDMARMFTSYISLTNGVAFAAIYAGAGGYNKWCMTGGAITCPAGSSGHTSPDPDNIAYQIQIESTGLTVSEIEMVAPECTTSSGPESCGVTPNASYSNVKVTANYEFTLLTPIVSNFLGTIEMTASTTAAVLN